MNTIQKIAKNFFSLSSAEVISRLFSFFTIIYLAMILGAENFGKIGFAQAIVAYFMIITNIGLTTLGTREIARNKDKIKHYTDAILTIRLILSFVTFLLLVLFTIFIHKTEEVKYLIISFGLSLFTYAFLIEWVFQGIERMEYVGISMILDKLFYFFLIFLFIKNSQHILFIPCFWLIGTIFGSGFLMVVFIKKFGRINLVFDFGLYRELLKRALPMGAAFILIQIYFNLDTIFLGFMKTDREVGWYTAAYKIILMLIMLNKFYFISIFPIISRYYKESIEKLSILLSYSAKLAVYLSLPMAVGGMVLARSIMFLFYTKEYAGGVVSFQILIWSVSASFICMVYSDSLIACDRQKEFMYGVAVGAVCNTILNFLLIPGFSLVGAAISTVISELVVLVYMYIAFKSIIYVSFNRYIAKPLIASLIMGFYLYRFSSWNIFILIISGFILYCCAIFLMKGITKAEFLVFKKLKE